MMGIVIQKLEQELQQAAFSRKKELLTRNMSQSVKEKVVKAVSPGAQRH